MPKITSDDQSVGSEREEVRPIRHNPVLPALIEIPQDNPAVAVPCQNCPIGAELHIGRDVEISDGNFQ